jgi:hypothetical protein
MSFRDSGTTNRETDCCCFESAGLSAIEEIVDAVVVADSSPI